MGCSATKVLNKRQMDDSDFDGPLFFLPGQVIKAAQVPLEVQVAHFTPSTFPLIPIINKNTARLCGESWKLIVASDFVDEYGVVTSGMTVFYNEFYERLDQVDTTGMFDSILTRHSSGVNKIAAKGAIILRIVKYVLSIENDSKQVQTMLYGLGKSHAKKSIRPWQYSVFVQTLLNTIASRLGNHAASDVMEAWVHIFAFVLKSMLPPSINGQVDEREICISSTINPNAIERENDLHKKQ